MRARILLVEDKESLRTLLKRLLEAFEVVEAADVAAVRSRLAEPFDLVLTDVRLPDGDGFEVLAAVHAVAPETEVVLMTAFAEVEAAVRAVKAGAYDYLQKPFEPDVLLMTVARALERRTLRARASAAEAALSRQAITRDMIGESAPMEHVRRLIARVADLDVTVLLTGQSGTGKEVAARAIHQGSRAGRPFVALNCGAIPGQLLESELFGHTRGAFTGAGEARAGLFEAAGNGTLFLDEIGDMPSELQVKLNRVLAERRFRRVGESRERDFQARIVAATLRDLPTLVQAGHFRQDLYFRLAVYPIHLPPLSARGDDIYLLAHHALKEATARFGRLVEGFETDALRFLATHPWPGNVRELFHAINRAVILADGPKVTAADLLDTLGEGPPTGPGISPPLADLNYRDALEWAHERALHQYLEALMRKHGGVVSQAAAQAGIERESLHRLLRKAGIEASSYRPG
jgi:DNA-binding NtrC family response regulator